MSPRTLTVQALHTFRAGGGVHLIPKGSRRQIVLPAGAGLEGAAFWTEDQRGQRFPQLFRVGVAHGWQVIAAPEAAKPRHATVPPWRAPVPPIAPGPASTSQTHEGGPAPASLAPAGPLPAPPVPAHPRAKGEPLAETVTDAALLLAMGARLGVLGGEEGGSSGGETESAGEGQEEAESIEAPEGAAPEDEEWP